MLDEPTDAELIESARDGDDAAFRMLVERYLSSVYTFCVRFTGGNTEDAEDAAQETFLKAWRHLDRVDTAKPLRTWLFAIARNAAVDVLRKRRHTVALSAFDNDDESGNIVIDTLVDTEPRAEELFERKEDAARVRAALEHIKPQERLILGMRYEDELSFEEIGHTLKIPASTVRSLHRRALASLRAHLATER